MEIHKTLSTETLYYKIKSKKYVNYTEVSYCCLQSQENPLETCCLSDIVSRSYVNSLSALLK